MESSDRRDHAESSPELWPDTFRTALNFLASAAFSVAADPSTAPNRSWRSSCSPSESLAHCLVSARRSTVSAVTSSSARHGCATCHGCAPRALLDVRHEDAQDKPADWRSEGTFQRVLPGMQVEVARTVAARSSVPRVPSETRVEAERVPVASCPLFWSGHCRTSSIRWTCRSSIWRAPDVSGTCPQIADIPRQSALA
jgi:hypothetical protein